MKVHSKNNPPMSPKGDLPGEGDMDRSSPILDDFDEELFIAPNKGGKGILRVQGSKHPLRATQECSTESVDAIRCLMGAIKSILNEFPFGQADQQPLPAKQRLQRELKAGAPDEML
ncbi:hypothetical protein GWK47_030341 [Chionoecetes opilio]|uniref:Uncharacterized protein n=1 Tax=Chionoecetes opilio TaxID=41210 RepID=A0A8J4YRU2_CHIOP|nr:hypothetical protein GWK47_030341 [Chionoecetes opilio]